MGVDATNIQGGPQLTFNQSLLTPVWDRHVPGNQILDRILSLGWSEQEFCKFLDEVMVACQNDLGVASRLIQERIDQIETQVSQDLRRRPPSPAEWLRRPLSASPEKVVMEETNDSLGEFSFRYCARHFPLDLQIGTLSLYEVPYLGEFLPRVTKGLISDNELLEEHALGIFLRGEWYGTGGRRFGDYFTTLRRRHNVLDQRRLVAKRLPAAIRHVTYEILLSGVEYMEAYYRLLDVSGIKLIKKCPPLRRHPNTYDLIASGLCGRWVGYDELTELFRASV